jgi:branched-subunit amino acid aminotransferase/4-amino-4-deoxychorismate lyase
LDDAPFFDELAAVAARMPGESRLRLIVTRGVDAAGPGNRVIIATPLGTPASELFPDGCTLHCVPVPPPGAGTDPHAKTGDRKLAVQATRAAQALGFYEALRVAPDGRVLEGATSTVFGVRAGTLITPPIEAGVLAGITRAKVLEQAGRLGVPVRLGTFLQSELADLDEVFITSSSRGVVPVRQIDTLTYAAPGPITRQLGLAYQALLEP